MVGAWGIFAYSPFTICAYTTLRNFTTATSFIAKYPVVELAKSYSNKSAFVYPNPTNNTATIEFKASKANSYTIEVVDIAGKVLKITKGVSTIGKNRMTIDFRANASGTYFINVIQPDKIKQTLKLNKE